ncbi:MAG: lipopolysaccharide biosynthesis protein RfbH [Elusimicrobia bacterium]|nr:lipopolysaccharide biosynthesis protein RfbH [Elusimicrobiota bacterium]
MSGLRPAPDGARRAATLEAARAYARERFAPTPFVPGKTLIPASGKWFDEEELAALVDASLDFWLTTGRYAEAFEAGLAAAVGARFAFFVNSGSSANLLALSALTAPELGERALKPGDEVVVTAASFPTTVNPAIQNGLLPVLVDVDIPTYNATAAMVAEALCPKTKAVMLAHALGNPFEAAALAELCEKRGIWLIEDCCDALGATHHGKPVSTFGAVGTFSFYPAHHITTGEGGAVVSSKGSLKRPLESFRDWGRDCWCPPGVDNTCGKRFGWTLGGLPAGYDHKYTYTNVGYNLKATDMQAAVGLVQLGRLERFVAARRANFDALKAALKPYERFLILPEATADSEASWFGFPLTVREGAPFAREALTSHLEGSKIATRLLFAGNVARQPYFKGVAHRKVGDLANADRVMRGTFWVGVHPGIDAVRRAYMIERFEAFFKAL